tara:strand:- start:3978 stop:4412 length:435 start_codon:yes stop_codon:yes gene_type:complete
MKVEGLADTQKKLKALSGKLGWAAMSKGLAASARPMRAAAKKNAPVGTESHRTYRGNLVSPGFAKQSVVLVRFKKKYNSTALVAVGVKKSAYYAAAFVESGWTHRSGTRVPAQPWLIKAYDQTIGMVPSTFVKSFRKMVLKAQK